MLHYSLPIIRGGSAENAGVTNAEVENAGVDSSGGKCKSGKCRSGKYRSDNVQCMKSRQTENKNSQHF